jgi:hypothetical protein
MAVMCLQLHVSIATPMAVIDEYHLLPSCGSSRQSPGYSDLKLSAAQKNRDENALRPRVVF